MKIAKGKKEIEIYLNICLIILSASSASSSSEYVAGLMGFFFGRLSCKEPCDGTDLTGLFICVTLQQVNKATSIEIQIAMRNVTKRMSFKPEVSKELGVFFVSSSSHWVLVLSFSALKLSVPKVSVAEVFVALVAWIQMAASLKEEVCAKVEVYFLNLRPILSYPKLQQEALQASLLAPQAVQAQPHCCYQAVFLNQLMLSWIY